MTPATLDELEQRIAALEDELDAGIDSLQPNVLTVDPLTGKIGATLTGALNANGGINLPLAGRNIGTFYKPAARGFNANALEWQDGTGVNRTAFYSYQLNNGGPPDQGVAQLVAAAAIDPGSGTWSNTAVLLDELGRSGFARVAAHGGFTLAFGVSSVTWPGGSNASNGTVIAHGVGGAIGADYFAGAIVSDTEFYVRMSNPSASQCMFVGVDPFALPPGGHSQQIYWLAIVQTV